MSELRQALAGYLDLRRGLGFKLDRDAKLLGQFTSWLEDHGAVTITTADALAPWLRERVRELDTLTVKGKAKDIRIFELMWQEGDEDHGGVPEAPAVALCRLHEPFDLGLGEVLPACAVDTSSARSPLNISPASAAERCRVVATSTFTRDVPSADCATGTSTP